MPLFTGPLWSEVVVPVIPLMGQIDLFKNHLYLIRPCGKKLLWNYYTKNVNGLWHTVKIDWFKLSYCRIFFSLSSSFSAATSVIFFPFNLQVWRLSWNVFGTVLASSGDDGKVKLWKGKSKTSHVCFKKKIVLRWISDRFIHIVYTLS